MVEKCGILSNQLKTVTLSDTFGATGLMLNTFTDQIEPINQAKCCKIVQIIISLYMNNLLRLE